jgi:hypothetical protein
VLVEDKRPTNGTHAEAQVLATAVAAFQFNNRLREKNGLKPLKKMIIPSIIMSGTRPTFYLVPVTTQLSEAVRTGQYPTTQIKVLQCPTIVKDMEGASIVGMEDVEYRRFALQRFLAFKELARGHWRDILKGVTNYSYLSHEFMERKLLLTLMG